MATAKKLKSGSWRCLVYDCMEDGKRKYKSFTAPTKKEAEHGAHHAVDGVVGEPAVRNEKGGDQAPGDEGSNVGHNHAAEEPSKFLDSFFHR